MPFWKGVSEKEKIEKDVSILSEYDLEPEEVEEL